MTPEEVYNKIDRIVKSREAQGESFPWIEFKPPNLLRVCGWCQLYVPENKQQELAENNRKVSEMAKNWGLEPTHGLCDACDEQMRKEPEETSPDSFQNVNTMSPEDTTAMKKQWELKMAIDDTSFEGDIPLYREEEEGIETEIAKWIGELEYVLDKNLPMEIIGDLIETPEDFFESTLGDYLSQMKADPEAGAFDFIKKYRDRISRAVVDLEEEPFSSGEQDEREVLKRKQFDESTQDKHAIQLLKSLEEEVEDFLNALPDETKNNYDIREDEERSFVDRQDHDQYWNDDEVIPTKQMFRPL